MILTLVQRYNNIQLYKFSKQSNKIDSHEEGISDNVDYLDWTESAFLWGYWEIFGSVVRFMPSDPLWLVSVLGSLRLFCTYGFSFVS